MNWIARSIDLLGEIASASSSNRQARTALNDARTRSLQTEALLLNLSSANIPEADQRVVREALRQVWEAQADCDGACEALGSTHVCLRTISRRIRSLIAWERNVLELSRSPKFRSYEAAEESLLHDQEELCISA